MLLYIHVPFCLSRCTYCAFHSQAIGQGTEASALVQGYVDTLSRELALHGEKFAGKRVQSVFFGGGTPSLLPPSAVEDLLGQVHKHFHVAQRPEITLEANPESLRSRTQASAYLASGVNRISIGIQSLDDAMLRLLGRRHKAIDSMHAVYNAREAGFANIGVDLIWGLPGQSVRQWLQSLREMVKLAPEHISSYGLTLEPGTELEKACESGRVVLPPERDQSIMFMEGAGILESAGYLHYEISNFARMGYQCRHNMGYWEGAEYLGLGPSATSTIGNLRWTNPASLKAWREIVEKAELGKNPETLTPETRVLELIMLRLRTARGLGLKDYKKLTGRDFLADNQRLIQALHENSLVRIRNGYLSLTRSGMLVSNSVISNLFERTREVLKNQPLALAPAPDTDPRILPVLWPKA